MAASVDPLVVGRVIGDVLDMYIPTANMSVYVGPKHITNGCEIKPSAAVKPPKVNISGNPDELYTLVYLFILSLIYIYVQSPLQTYLWLYQPTGTCIHSLIYALVFSLSFQFMIYFFELDTV